MAIRFLTSRDAIELQTLVDAVPSNPVDGIGVEALAAKVALPTVRVEQLLAQHPKYFVHVGARRLYSLNRFGALRGSRSSMRADIKATLREGLRASRLQKLTLAMAGAAAASGVVGAGFLGREQWFAAFAVAAFPAVVFICIAAATSVSRKGQHETVARRGR